MSIETTIVTELNRISTAKSNLVNWMKNSGVTSATTAMTLDALVNKLPVILTGNDNANILTRTAYSDTGGCIDILPEDLRGVFSDTTTFLESIKFVVAINSSTGMALVLTPTYVQQLQSTGIVNTPDSASLRISDGMIQWRLTNSLQLVDTSIAWNVYCVPSIEATT